MPKPKKNLDPSSGVDLGDPPLVLVAQQHREAQLLAEITGGGPLDGEQNVSVNDDGSISPVLDDIQPVVPLRPALRTQKVTLNAESFQFDLEVYDFDVQENFISLSIPWESPVLKFKDVMPLVIVCNGVSHPVKYVGGYCELKQHRIKVMSFLKDEGKETNGKKRKNREKEDSVNS
jgi:hypothetical protein